MVPPPAATVLVADDSATVRALVRAELEAAGYAVTEVADGRQALDAVQAQAPDVLLLDVEMPVLDGFATIAALKADPRTADVPVVFLTSRGTSEDVVGALRLGAHDYVRKPPEPAELLARVGAAAEVSGLRRELRRRTEELDRMSRTDHLTGLYNRRHAEEHLAAAVTVSRRHGTPVAVLLVDIDRFKAVNDELGHEAGDVVLVAVAARLQASLRGEDLVARWGGEEFLVLASHADADGAAQLAERLRAAVSIAPVRVAGTEVDVRVSIGGASGQRISADALLRAADTRLYDAKAAGRDCARLESLQGPEQRPQA